MILKSFSLRFSKDLSMKMLIKYPEKYMKEKIRPMEGRPLSFGGSSDRSRLWRRNERYYGNKKRI